MGLVYKNKVERFSCLKVRKTMTKRMMSIMRMKPTMTENILHMREGSCLSATELMLC